MADNSPEENFPDANSSKEEEEEKRERSLSVEVDTSVKPELIERKKQK